MQWVRIEGRSPGTHKLPSRAVEALWRALRPNERDWETFCNSLDMKLDAGLDALTHWVPDDDSEPMRATWSDAFDDEVPFTGYPTLFIVDGEVGIADPATDLPDPDPAPSFRGLRGSLGRPNEPRHCITSPSRENWSFDHDAACCARSNLRTTPQQDR